MDQIEIITGKRIINEQEINDKVNFIIENYNPEMIILFGSYASGEPSPESDVDLLIVVETTRSTLELSSEISQKLRHNFPIDIIVRTPQEISKRIKHGDFFIQNVMEKGKVLYERTDRGMDSESRS